MPQMPVNDDNMFGRPMQQPPARPDFGRQMPMDNDRNRFGRPMDNVWGKDVDEARQHNPLESRGMMRGRPNSQGADPWKQEADRFINETKTNDPYLDRLNKRENHRDPFMSTRRSKSPTNTNSQRFSRNSPNRGGGGHTRNESPPRWNNMRNSSPTRGGPIRRNSPTKGDSRWANSPPRGGPMRGSSPTRGRPMRDNSPNRGGRMMGNSPAARGGHFRGNSPPMRDNQQQRGYPWRDGSPTRDSRQARG